MLTQSSFICPVWVNGCVFVNELNSCEYKSHCSHLGYDKHVKYWLYCAPNQTISNVYDHHVKIVTFRLAKERPVISIITTVISEYVFHVSVQLLSFDLDMS